MQCFDIATHAVHFTECSGLWRTSSGAWDPQNTEFLLLAWPDREKWASLLNHTFWKKSGFSSILLLNHWHISTRFAMLFCVRVCLVCSLCGYNWRSFFKILWTDKRERPNFLERLRSDFFGLGPAESLTASTFSRDLALNFLSLVDFCSVLGGLYQCSCVLKLLYPAGNLELMGKVIEIKPSAVSRLDSIQWFRLQIEGHAKCFFLY